MSRETFELHEESTLVATVVTALITPPGNAGLLDALTATAVVL